MNNKTTFSPVTAPGLPTWPVLMFDSVRRRAKVSLRLATWQNWTYAHYASQVIRFVLSFIVGGYTYTHLGFIENWIGQSFWAIIGACFFSTIIKPIVHTTCDGFLARQVFATRTVLWLNPQSIAFRSSLYTNGVVLWRNWKHRPISIQFDITSAPNAQNHQHHADPARQQLQQKQQSNCLLRAIISTPNQHHLPTTPTNPNLMRAIPILELDQEDAANVTMVLIAATSLTQQSPKEKTTPKHGTDIDVT